MCYCIHKCSCVALQIAQEYIHEDQDIQFLISFNEDQDIRIYPFVIQEESNQKFNAN